MRFVRNLHLQSSRICFGAIKTIFNVEFRTVIPFFGSCPGGAENGQKRQDLSHRTIVLDCNSALQVRNQYHKSSSIQKIVKHNYSSISKMYKKRLSVDLPSQERRPSFSRLRCLGESSTSEQLNLSALTSLRNGERRGEIAFPASLSAGQRASLHKFAGKLGLLHTSRGDGAKRRVVASMADVSARLNELERVLEIEAICCTGSFPQSTRAGTP